MVCWVNSDPSESGVMSFLFALSGSSALTESCFLSLSDLFWRAALVSVANVLGFACSILKNAFEKDLCYFLNLPLPS